MVGNLEFKWHDMDDQLHHTEVVAVVDEEGDYYQNTFHYVYFKVK